MTVARHSVYSGKQHGYRNLQPISTWFDEGLCFTYGHDWQNHYGYRPVLLETFVEPPRFNGTCYKAANWLYLGQTKGRGKLDVKCEAKLPIKSILIYPLASNFRSVLCH